MTPRLRQNSSTYSDIFFDHEQVAHVIIKVTETLQKKQQILS